MTNAYIIYKGKKVYVTVDSYFMGGSGRMANVTAIEGYPFFSGDTQSQGTTSGAWNCNGRRVRIDFVMIEPHPVDEAQQVERDIDEQLDGTEPSPIISGGEVLYMNYHGSNDIPF